MILFNHIFECCFFLSGTYFRFIKFYIFSIFINTLREIWNLRWFFLCVNGLNLNDGPNWIIHESSKYNLLKFANRPTQGEFGIRSNSHGSVRMRSQTFILEKNHKLQQRRLWPCRISYIDKVSARTVALNVPLVVNFTSEIIGFVIKTLER